MAPDARTRRRAGIALAAAAGGVLLAIPLFAPGYWVQVLTDAFMYAAFTQGVNFVAGYAGYAAFGNVVFFGIGAYAAAVLMVRAHLGFALALVGAGAASAALAVVFGVPILRLRGAYFAIATLALNIALQDVTVNLGFTGGSHGVRLPFVHGGPRLVYGYFYYGMFALAVACIAATWLLMRGRLGYGIRALRDNPDAAEVMGIDTTRYKILAWAVSAVMAGLAGAIYAYWVSYIEPPFVYDITISVKGFLMMLLGGAGTLMGPFVGAMVFEILSDLIWGNFPNVHLLVLGVIIMGIVAFLPQGIVGLAGGGRGERRRAGRAGLPRAAPAAESRSEASP
jgi:branched-chain amino acid transport system permease protein